jgi:hypothetical protein
MSRRFLVPALFLTIVILAAVPALAQVQPIEGCTIIDKPGSYVLTKNVAATVSDLRQAAPGRFTSACIVIVADFVSLDLQGNTIAGPQAWEAPNNAGIYATANDSGKEPTTVHIRNGCVTGFMAGISVEGTGHIVEQVRVAGNEAGIVIRGDGIRVKEAIAVSNRSHGILWFGNHGVSVENCQVSSNRYIGILQFQSDWVPNETVGGRIVGNTISNNGAYGIYAYCPTLILQNMAYNNGCSQGSGCHDIVVKGFGCNMSTDNLPIQANPDYPGVP